MSIQRRDGFETRSRQSIFLREGEEKMRKIHAVLVFCGVLGFLWGGVLAPPASAILGDIDGDGNAWTSQDLTYLIAYLFDDGPAPPNPIDADVDGFPGINIGDVLQLADHFVSGSCWPIPYAGVGVRGKSQIRFVSDVISSMESGASDTVQLRIVENGGPGVVAMVIPLSYASRPDQVEVVLDSVSFEGSIIPSDWSQNFYIDNEQRTVLFVLSGEGSEMSPGTTGPVATLYFTKVLDGEPLTMSPTEIPPSHSFTLISSPCAQGVPDYERILSPKLSLSLNGDLNCDGEINLADVVYAMNYLYKGGPPPCGL